MSADSTAPVPAALEILESTRPTAIALAALEHPELAKSTLAVSGASDVPPGDFAYALAAIVGIEVANVSEVLEEEMVN